MIVRTLLLALALLAPLAAAQTSAPSIEVVMDQATYSAASTLLGGVAPVATVTITTLDGENVAPLAGVEVTVTFLRQVQLIGFVNSESVTGVTDENGVFSAEAPQLSGAPGNYLVAAFALGTAGSTTYSVGP